MLSRGGKKLLSSPLYLMENENIFPCNRVFCKCVEYLDFGKKKDIKYYHQCFITYMNNKKYEIKKYP